MDWLKQWKIHDPRWKDENGKRVNWREKWYGVYGTGYYMSGGKTVERVMLDYPESADHFYYLYKTGYMNADIIFASYSAEEVRKFVRQMSWTERNKKCFLYVRDEPNKDLIEGDRFVKMFMEE